MSRAHQLGIRHMHLNTNGIRLNATRRAEVLAAGVRSFNISVDGPDPETHDRIRGRRGAFAITVRHLEGLIAERERYGLKIRMNFTVMEPTVGQLPEIARLAQRLRVRLYLNLATNKTFLFRAEGIDELAGVAGEQVRAAMAAVEELARADPAFLPRYSDLAYVARHFADPIQRRLP